MRGIALALALLAAACSPSAVQVQARAANAVALAGNTATTLLVAEYRRQGLAIVQAAPDRATAEAQLEGHRQRWRRVFGDCEADACRDGALPALREAHTLWAIALERRIAGEAVEAGDLARALERLVAAYCGLRAAAAPDVALPQLPPPLAACGGPAP